MVDQLGSAPSHGIADGSLQAGLLDAVLDSWDRSNRILLNLLRSLPPGGLSARVLPGSPTVSQMFMHIHHERMISVAEEAPEYAGPVPEQEWAIESDASRIQQLLAQSAATVRNAVEGRIRSGRQLDRHYDHPALLLQLLLFHESYHHGQIKLACKAAGTPVSDETAGPLTWDVWRRRSR
ncbi:MAG TPA: DinB family protein [Bryobacteraceae bacterium]|nr:DinB family protein [Bryobacteraceae bacterium]